MIAAEQALQRLREGNQRFVDATSTAHTSQHRPAELQQAQWPFAIVLGCSDSRVPAEIVFDQGLGDLFVIRVAGNVAAPSQIGSVEFAAQQFGTQLVVVLGHTSCGAVSATLEELEHPVTDRSENLRAIVDRIRPALEPILDDAPVNDHQALLDRAVRANIGASVAQLRHGSPTLERLIEGGRLRVVGAEYSLHSGRVQFFDDNGGTCG